jgi:hypothetical protein
LPRIAGRSWRTGSAAIPRRFGALLETRLPRFPFPALRRVYQRLAYAGYVLRDEWL